jgi:predicted ATPase
VNDSNLATDYPSLRVKNLAQIKEADVKFGDFTLLVGPQASGKSIFLQMLKLILDPHLMALQLTVNGYDWGGNVSKFLELVFGEGMSSIWQKDTQIRLGRKQISFSANSLEKFRTTALKGEAKLFYIIAQRVLTIQSGWPRAFSSYEIGDPYVVKGFSETLRRFLENETGKTDTLIFPKPGRIQKSLQELFEKDIFFGSRIELDTSTLKKRFLLNVAGTKLPYMTWSAGQKEFMPLLLSFYFLLPINGEKHKNLEWVVIEEPEMGLHPQAIQSLMIIFLELMARGYRLVISTHSPILLELAWAMRFIQTNGGTSKHVLELFDLPQNADLKKIAETALNKSFKTYYFDRKSEGVFIKDISSLDPFSEDDLIADWGGLTTFSTRAGDVVAKIAANA